VQEETAGASQLHYNTNFTAIADTGASHHYLHSRFPYTSFNNNEPPTHVTVANGDIVTSIGKAKVPLPQLPPGTDDCFIMDTFPINRLRMGQFCDADCMVTFTKTKVYVFNSAGSLVLDGFQEKIGARMWRFNIHAPNPHTAMQASPTHNRYEPHVIPFLSRECLRLRCLPEPSFADMSYVAATCRRHVFAHVADTATLHVG
jgi:hypothetical protein